MPFTCLKIVLTACHVGSLVSFLKKTYMHVTRRLFDENMLRRYVSLKSRSRVYLIMIHASIKNMTRKMSLTYIDAQDWLPPTSEGLSSEQPVVERIHACTQLASQARTLVCPCRSCTRYAALGGEDAHYSWSHTVRRSHACHRRHPKTFTKRNY